MYAIDVNCDVGEGAQNEAQLFPFISSCSIACGGHAGNQQSMHIVSKLAKMHKVRVGAHPSYPDKANFGRLSIDVSKKTFIESIRNQIASLAAILKKEQISLHHIKPHGALYNDLAKDHNKANIFLEAIVAYKMDILLYVPYNSIIEQLALANGFKIVYEAFADRNYGDDLKLISRSHPKALIYKPKEVLEHVVHIITKQKVTTLTQQNLDIVAQTVCVHSDTPHSLEIVSYLSQELPKHNIIIK